MSYILFRTLEWVLSVIYVCIFLLYVVHSERYYYLSSIWSFSLHCETFCTVIHGTNIFLHYSCVHLIYYKEQIIEKSYQVSYCLSPSRLVLAPGGGGCRGKISRVLNFEVAQLLQSLHGRLHLSFQKFSKKSTQDSWGERIQFAIYIFGWTSPKSKCHQIYKVDSHKMLLQKFFTWNIKYIKTRFTKCIRFKPYNKTKTVFKYLSYITATPVYRPLFQDKLGKPVSER